MTDEIKLPKCSWKRPPGPVNVWKIIESQVKLEDGTARPLWISIQEVPEHRQQEAVELMLKYFVRDEPINISLDAANDPKMLHDLRLLWNYCLCQGITEAAYVLDENNHIGELAAVNMLLVTTDEVDKDMEELLKLFQSTKGKKLLKIMGEMSKKADARVIYGVTKYIAALGLIVAPKFRGQKLGLHMLNARTEIGKKYDIPVSSTVFTARASQILAERAGFENKFSQDYAEILDDEKKPFFPSIETKNMKIMMKRLY